MEKEKRIEYLERGINSSLTPEHIRLQMQETLSKLLAPEPPPIIVKPKRVYKPRVKRVPTPPPPPPPPPARELTIEEAEAKEEEYRKRRERRVHTD